ncbi:hypothetical protein [Cytobacillus purgationiresistens]|uniref:Uncharacterized protein n=1 Tax=Cytobacillus purgationiresistens TaxID=863449 RepID=A0ABU0ABF3_9BACI|nr:hypothetical protein [Cytobacillus purgationiresistens]MDQ0268584.1 hypothetical protein [Cytobacillus purgationiresistens]
MSCTTQNCFDICFKVVINTNSERAETFVECGEECSGIEIDFKNGILTIVLPLVACIETTLNDDLTAKAKLESLSFPGYF